MDDNEPLALLHSFTADDATRMIAEICEAMDKQIQARREERRKMMSGETYTMPGLSFLVMDKTTIEDALKVAKEALGVQSPSREALFAAILDTAEKLKSENRDLRAEVERVNEAFHRLRDASPDRELQELRAEVERLKKEIEAIKQTETLRALLDACGYKVYEDDSGQRGVWDEQRKELRLGPREGAK